MKFFENYEKKVLGVTLRALGGYSQTQFRFLEIPIYEILYQIFTNRESHEC